MSGQPNDAEKDQRQKYVMAWNATMVAIWRERIQLTGAIDTGSLLDSIRGLRIIETSEGKFLDFTLSQSFLRYGIYVDAGVGREVYRTNPGDIGRDKVRKPKKWFSKKYYASILNLRDFIADNIGLNALNIVSEAIDTDSKETIWKN